jgi:hypothetical protein
MLYWFEFGTQMTETLRKLWASMGLICLAVAKHKTEGVL